MSMFDPPEGYERHFKQCKVCDKLCVYDFIPYSLSSAIRIPPCGHDFRTEFKNLEKDVWIGLFNRTQIDQSASD